MESKLQKTWSDPCGDIYLEIAATDHSAVGSALSNDFTSFDSRVGEVGENWSSRGDERERVETLVAFNDLFPNSSSATTGRLADRKEASRRGGLI